MSKPERALARNQISQYFDAGLLASGTMRNKFLLLEASQSTVFCEGRPS